MAWTVEFTDKAAKSFKKLDKPVQEPVVKFLREVAQDDARTRGKGLTANRTGLWAWRVGDWRIIANLDNAEMLVLVVDVDHRSTVYRTNG